MQKFNKDTFYKQIRQKLNQPAQPKTNAIESLLQASRKKKGIK